MQTRPKMPSWFSQTSTDTVSSVTPPMSINGKTQEEQGDALGRKIDKLESDLSPDGRGQFEKHLGSVSSSIFSSPLSEKLEKEKREEKQNQFEEALFLMAELNRSLRKK